VAIFPSTFYEISLLPEAEKIAIYRTLLTDWVFERYGVDRQTLHRDGHPVFTVRAPSGSSGMEITLRLTPDARDPLVYLNMCDTANYQLCVLLLVINDPESPRFDVDVDENGNSTKMGTAGRNLKEEERALQFGLAPGQVRAGLRVFRASVPVFEQFVTNMGHDMIFIEPLSYHNAITFERYGFAYTYGKKSMESIHHELQPGGNLHAALDGSTPFRQPEAWKTVRGRSWAIHDGILGKPFSGFQMYKRVGQHAGINTFPESVW